MKPIEKSKLPTKLDRVGTYINGSLINLRNPAFVANGKMFLPIKQVCQLLDFKVEGMDPRLTICGLNKKILVSAGIYDVSEGKNTELQYDIKVVDGALYVESAFLSEQLEVSFGWEAETGSLYVTTVLLYDGYRVAPDSIFDVNDVNRQYHGMYLYVDGMVVNQENGFTVVKTEKGTIYLKAMFARATIGDKNRFCFSYNAGDYIDGCPTGSLMEVVPQENRFKFGKILYTEESWNSFKNVEENKPIQKKHNEEVKPGNASDKKWKNPSLHVPVKYGDFIYLQPTAWRSRAAEEPYEGTYYYPYDKSETGMVWISRIPNTAKTTGEYFPYHALLNGMCQGDVENIIFDEETKVAGIRGRRANYKVEASGTLQDIIVYILPRPDYVYLLTFGERDSLSNNMREFVDEFTQKMKRS